MAMSPRKYKQNSRKKTIAAFFKNNAHENQMAMCMLNSFEYFYLVDHFKFGKFVQEKKDYAFHLWFLNNTLLADNATMLDASVKQRFQSAHRQIRDFYQHQFGSDVSMSRADRVKFFQYYDSNKLSTFALVCMKNNARGRRDPSLISSDGKPYFTVLAAISFEVLKNSPGKCSMVHMVKVAKQVDQFGQLSLRKMGFGTFMLLLLVKYGVVMNDDDINTSLAYPLFLQRSDANDVPSFFTQLGFVLMEETDADIASIREFDGFQPELSSFKLLPGGMRILSSQYDAVGVSAVAAELDVPSNVTVVVDDGSSLGSGTQSMLWSSFPFRMDSGVRGDDIVPVLAACPILSKLSPQMPGMVLKHDNENHLRGYITKHRKDLLLKNPKTWFQTSEMDFMLSFLVRNGDYSDIVSIIPTRFCLNFQRGIVAYEEACKATKLRGELVKQKVKNLTVSLEQTFFRRYKKSVEDAYKQSWKCSDDIVRELLTKDPDLFLKPLIVFPDNSSGNHWRAIFVFNAQSILTKASATRKPACFFRYDPYDPDGCGKFDGKNGFAWFFNFILSRHVFLSLKRRPKEMNWLHNFGDIDSAGFVKGIDGFEAIRLKPEQAALLPKQQDTWNCGIAMVATTAIMMQWVKSSFNELFSNDNISFTGKEIKMSRNASFFECAIEFESVFGNASDESINNADWLPQLRQEWISVFEKLEVLQNRPILLDTTTKPSAGDIEISKDGEVPPLSAEDVITPSMGDAASSMGVIEPKIILDTVHSIASEMSKAITQSPVGRESNIEEERKSAVVNHKLFEGLEHPKDLSVENVVLGWIKENESEKYVNSSPIPMSAVGLTAVTLINLCEKGVKWQEDVMNTCAAMLHKLGPQKDHLAVIPSCVTSSDFGVLKENVLESTTDLYMLVYDDGYVENDDSDDDANMSDEMSSGGHWMLVELLKTEKAINVYDSDGLFVKDPDKLQECSKVLFKSILTEIAWMTDSEEVIPRLTDCGKEECLDWQMLFTKIDCDVGDDYDYCGPVAILQLAGGLLGKDWLPHCKNGVKYSIREQACHALCKCLHLCWKDVVWPDDDQEVRLVRAYTDATCNSVTMHDFMWERVYRRHCHICKTTDASCVVHLFCLHCCVSVHFRCWLNSINVKEKSFATFGRQYRCCECNAPLKSVLVKEKLLLGILSYEELIDKLVKLSKRHQWNDIETMEDVRIVMHTHTAMACLDMCDIVGLSREAVFECSEDSVEKFRRAFVELTSTVGVPSSANAAEYHSSDDLYSQGEDKFGPDEGDQDNGDDENLNSASSDVEKIGDKEDNRKLPPQNNVASKASAVRRSPRKKSNDKMAEENDVSNAVTVKRGNLAKLKGRKLPLSRTQKDSSNKRTASPSNNESELSALKKQIVTKLVRGKIVHKKGKEVGSVKTIPAIPDGEWEEAKYGPAVGRATHSHISRSEHVILEFNEEDFKIINNDSYKISRNTELKARDDRSRSPESHDFEEYEFPDPDSSKPLQDWSWQDHEKMVQEAEKPFELEYLDVPRDLYPKPELSEDTLQKFYAKFYNDNTPDSFTYVNPDNVKDPEPEVTKPNESEATGSQENEKDRAKEGDEQSKKPADPDDDVMMLDTEEFRNFVEKSWQRIGFGTTLQHKEFVFNEHKAMLAAKKNKLLKEKQRTNLIHYHESRIRGANRERENAKEKFQREYLVTQPGFLTGVKYLHNRDLFYGKVRYKYIDDRDGDKVKIKEETIVIPPRLVFDSCDLDYIRNIMELSRETIEVKKKKQTFWPVLRKDVKYITAENQSDEDHSSVVRIQFNPSIERWVRDRSQEMTYDPKTGTWTCPQIREVTKDTWWGILDDNTKVPVEEQWVVENFGNKYVKFLRDNANGYIDVPTGDFRESRLDLYPYLQVENAPPVHYTQKCGEQLCLPNSLASVLYYLGFVVQAEQLFQFGKSYVSENPVQILDTVKDYCKGILPNWVKCYNVRCDFSWKKDLCPGRILFAIIRECDGNISHGICVHNQLIYDANEMEAFRLCQEGLDYCTMKDNGNISYFRDFYKAYVFEYVGTNPARRKMMNPLER